MKLKKHLRIALLPTAVALALTACGGGGGVSSGGISLSSPGSPSGWHLGPVSGGRIYIDMDDSHTHTPADVQCGTTSSNGSYVCYYPNGLTEATNTHLLLGVGGVDSYTNLAINQPHLSPPGSTQISPLTTLATLQALSGIPAGTTLNLTTFRTTFTQANLSVVQSLRLPAGTRVDRDDALAPGNERLLAAETAVQSLLEETVAAISTATGLPTSSLGTSYDAAFRALSNEIANLRGQLLNLSTTGVGTPINNVISAAGNVTTLGASGVQNVISIANQPIASSIAPTLSMAAASTPASALTIQNAATNSVSNITAINQTINVIKNTIRNVVYTGPQIGGVRNVYNTIFRGGYTANNITNINNSITQLTTMIANITYVVAPAASFPNTWEFNGISVAGNGYAPVSASGIGAVTSTLGGSYNISAVAATSGVPAAPIGLQTATMTLIPNSGMNNAITTGSAQGSYVANIGLSITPTNVADGRRIQAVIQNVPVTVDATGMHITSLAGATLSAFGNNSRNLNFNVVLSNLPTNLLTTATNAAATTAGLANSTDVTLDIQALFNVLSGVGGNAGFANLRNIVGTFDVSMAINLQDTHTLGFPPVYIADSTAVGFHNAGSQYLSTNIMAVTNSQAQVLGQGKVLNVTLN